MKIDLGARETLDQDDDREAISRQIKTTAGRGSVQPGKPRMLERSRLALARSPVSLLVRPLSNPPSVPIKWGPQRTRHPRKVLNFPGGNFDLAEEIAAASACRLTIPN
jgi:hypothetical protein